MLSKGKLDPNLRLTIPRMEPDGTAIRGRLAEFAKNAMAKKSGRTMNRVDSSTAREGASALWSAGRWILICYIWAVLEVLIKA